MSLWTTHRARRGTLPTRSAVHVVDGGVEAVFPIGLTSGQGRLSWLPWDGDHPHCLIAGTTGSGKSRLMETWALQPLIGGWDWDVEVLDGKGAADHWAAASNGAAVHSTPDAIVAALQRAVDDIRRRSELMNETPIIRTRIYDQVVVEDRALTFRDLPEDVRLAAGMRPRLIVIDELASVIGMAAPGAKAIRANKAKGIAARPAVPGASGAALIFTIVQLARSAGIHLLLGIQRPDAKLIDGFVRHNVPSRILFGPANSDAEEMVLESAIQDHPERGLPRPTGTGFAVAIGGRQIVRFHADLLDRDRYLPLHAPAAADGGVGVAGDAVDSTAPVDPSHRVPSPTGGRDASPSPDPSRPVAVGVTPVGGTPHSTGLAAPVSGWRRFTRGVRPVALGPLVRVALRVSAVRCLTRPVVAGPFIRDPFLAVACKDAAGYRCEACGAPGPVESDHRVPLSFAGRDAASNLQALCIRPHRGGCHGAKTSGEMFVWRLRTKGQRGVGLPAAHGVAAFRAFPLWVRVGVAVFLTGVVTGGRWGGYAVAVLVALTLGPVLLRAGASRVPILSVVVKVRGPGLDGIQNWDARLEEEGGGGFRRFFTRRWYGGRSGLAWTRIRLAAASAVYVAGWQVTALPAVVVAVAGLFL